MAPTFLGFSRALQVTIVSAFAVVPAVLGWFLPDLVGWALGLPLIPFRAVLRLLDETPEPWLSVGGSGLGLLIGGWVGVLAVVESLAITLTDDQIRLKINGTTRTFDRAQIAAAFLDAQQLVLLGPDTRELAREKPEVSGEAVAAGFRAHGYPWREADPYRDAFRLWVPELPGLPAGANALLSARARARAKKQKDDAQELRREAAALGVVVRDEGNRQYWRLVPGTEPSGSAETQR